MENNVMNCPLCGGETITRVGVVISQINHKLELKIECLECGCTKTTRVKVCDTSFDTLISAMNDATIEWNRRAYNEDGVIVPPCKVGTTVYLPCLDDNGEIETYTITEFVLDKDGLYFLVDDENRETHSIDIIGKDCFLDEEQAEQKLKEMGDSNAE